VCAGVFGNFSKWFCNLAKPLRNLAKRFCKVAESLRKLPQRFFTVAMQSLNLADCPKSFQAVSGSVSKAFRNLEKCLRNIAKPLCNLAKWLRKVAQPRRKVAKRFRDIGKALRNIRKCLPSAHLLGNHNITEIFSAGRAVKKRWQKICQATPSAYRCFFVQKHFQSQRSCLRFRIDLIGNPCHGFFV
jgi:hypothetical protein